MSNTVDRIREFQTSAPVNVEGLIESLGIELERKAKLDPAVAGQIECVAPGRFRISANAADHYYRRRFTMAHELAHFLFHRDLIGTGLNDSRAYRSTDRAQFYNRAVTERHEAEANRFAAQLLMPKELVQREWERCGRDPVATAKALQVSTEALGYRLDALGLRSAH